MYETLFSVQWMELFSVPIQMLQQSSLYNLRFTWQWKHSHLLNCVFLTKTRWKSQICG